MKECKIERKLAEVGQYSWEVEVKPDVAPKNQDVIINFLYQLFKEVMNNESSIHIPS